MITATVELFYSGVWNDITQYVYHRDRINITRGRTSEGSAADPGTLTLTLDNRDGRFSLRDPAAALWGLIGRGTPVRVTASSSVRFVGEAVSWSPRSDESGNDVYIHLEASGVLRRLDSGDQLTSSALRHSIPATSPAVYWPQEDAANAFGAESGLQGGVKMVQTGGAVVNATVEDVPAGTRPLPDFVASVGQLRGEVSDVAGDWIVGFLISFEGSDNWRVMRIGTGGGPFQFILVLFGPSQIEVQGYTSPDAAATTVGVFGDGLSGDGYHWFELHASESGGTVSYAGRLATADGVYLRGSSSTTASLGTQSGSSAGPLTSLTIRSYTDGGAVSGTLGHLVAWSATDAGTGNEAVESVNGHAGETAGRRIERLLSDVGVAFASSGDLDETAAMGPQPAGTLRGLLRECETADGGILFETRTALGLTYRTRHDLYNQTPALELDYAGGELSPPFHPAEDDLGLVNDWTVTRSGGGGSARAVLESGALSVQDPPDGAHRWESGIEVNVESDADLPSQAGWRLHLSTWPTPRFDLLTLNLRRLAETLGDTTLRNAVLAADAGDLATVDGLPAWMGPDLAELLLQGYSETVAQDEHVISFNAASGGPYNVAEVGDDVLGRADTDGSQTAASFVAGTDTSMSVSVTAGPLWTTDAGELPLDILAAGVRLTVSAISGTSSPQTFTITQTPVNGVTKTVPSGSAVSLWQPAVVAL